MKTFNKAMQCLQKGEIERGIELLLKVLEEAPGHIDALYNLGLAYGETGDFDRSVATLKQCLEVKPDYTGAWVALGFSLYRQKSYAAAVEALEHALQIEPNHVFALMNLGGVLAFQGRLEDAAQTMERAYALLPDDPAILHGLAKLKEDLGDLDSAEKYLKELEKITEVANQATLALKRIEAKRAQINTAAVDFLSEALQVFAAKPVDSAQQIVDEIAALGRKAVKLTVAETKEAEETYTLSSLPGRFTGLQMICYLYAGTKQVGGDVRGLADLAIEYHIAQELHKKSHPVN